jgi:integrase
MAQTIGKLSAVQVKAFKEPGYHSDGGCLYFRVSKTGARGWIFRFAFGGRTRDMGLGGFPEISLASARDLAEKFRKIVQQGIDPIDQRRATRAEQQVVAAKSRTFDDCAREYIADHEGAWRSATHRTQWTNTLKSYASPVFGKLPVSAIDTGMVMRALKPLWSKRTETASRLRGRIESVLDWARVHGFRSGENPARWKGHLDQLLPGRSKVQPVKHYAALPYPELPAFLAMLRERREHAALALQFVIFTASRTGEVLGATWDEIDLANKTWAVPPERMKAGEIHRVPLSRSALAILHRMEAVRIGDFVFAGAKIGRPMSDMSLLLVLRRLGRDDVTVHGFRSTFRDWAAERTNFPRDVAEAALAHTESNKVEAAYKRTDFFEKRRRLMDAWADYCASSPAGEVIPLHRHG